MRLHQSNSLASLWYLVSLLADSAFVQAPHGLRASHTQSATPPETHTWISNMNSNFSWGQNTDGSIPDLLFTRRCHDIYHVMFLYVVFSWCVFDVEGNHTCIFHLEIFRLLVPVVVVVFSLSHFSCFAFFALLFFFWFMIYTGLSSSSSLSLFSVQ